MNRRSGGARVSRRLAYWVGAPKICTRHPSADHAAGVGNPIAVGASCPTETDRLGFFIVGQCGCDGLVTGSPRWRLASVQRDACWRDGFVEGGLGICFGLPIRGRCTLASLLIGSRGDRLTGCKWGFHQLKGLLQPLGGFGEGAVVGPRNGFQGLQQGGPSLRPDFLPVTQRRRCFVVFSLGPRLSLSQGFFRRRQNSVVDIPGGSHSLVIGGPRRRISLIHDAVCSAPGIFKAVLWPSHPPLVKAPPRR